MAGGGDGGNATNPEVPIFFFFLYELEHRTGIFCHIGIYLPVRRTKPKLQIPRHSCTTFLPYLGTKMLAACSVHLAIPLGRLS